MSRIHIGSPRNFDREGFEPLNRGDATIEIPLDQISHTPQRPAPVTAPNSYYNSQPSEKAGPFVRQGLRHSAKARNHQRLRKTGYDGEEDSVTRMGLVYKRILKSSAITRYIVFVLPLGSLLAIPIVVGAVAAKDATLGGVRIVWFFLWLECCWCGLWVSKLVAHILPRIFQALCGIVSAGTRKYSSILKALEIPLSLVGWALVSLATFMPIMRVSHEPILEWMSVMNRILASALISSLLFLAERLFIQIITINYHRKQFNAKIKQSKHSVYLLTLLYDASRAMFPTFCQEFSEEDAIIRDNIEVAFSGHKKKGRSGSSTPMRALREAGKFADKVTAAFGNVAQEVTGKQLSDPTSAHSIVVEALEKNRSSEALARRLWLSFVIEGNDALYQDDIIEVLGAGREAEAEECFYHLDQDGNGDVSLDEMILTVAQWGRDRHSIAKSLNDVDEAIKVLDTMLCVIVFISVVFVFIAFLNTSFVTTLATTGTALLSLSFVFSVSAQEVLGSCIFLFVKHPFDIGDRINLNEGVDQFVVEHISLLFTVFRRIDTHRAVQIPNILLNTLWVENVSRSPPSTEQLSLFVAFDTSLEDIQLLRKEMLEFVMDKQNSRDFQPTFEVEVVGINEMDKLELSVQIAQKSSWSNETVRAARRSKFMCALVLALRKVPIYGPAGGDPALGTMGNPSYSVGISDSEAAMKRGNATKEKEAMRFVPSSPGNGSPVEKNMQGLGSSKELGVMTMLNERSPALDGAWDVGSSRDVGGSPTLTRGPYNQEFEEIRGVLRRETTKGRRTSGKTGDNPDAGVTGSTGVTVDTDVTDDTAASISTSDTVASLPRIGTTTASSMPRQSVRAIGLGEDISSSSEDYWNSGIAERTESVMGQEGMYSNFPPPPPPTVKPREGPPPPRAGFQQYKPHPPPPPQAWRQ